MHVYCIWYVITIIIITIMKSNEWNMLTNLDTKIMLAFKKRIYIWWKSWLWHAHHMLSTPLLLVVEHICIICNIIYLYNSTVDGNTEKQDNSECTKNCIQKYFKNFDVVFFVVVLNFSQNESCRTFSKQAEKK